MKKLSFVIALFIGLSSFSQENNETTLSYFNQFLTSESQFKLLVNSFPTLEECKQILIGENAETYYKGIQKLKQEIKDIQTEVELETYTKSHLEFFSSNDAKKKDAKRSSRFYKIKDILQPDITYYLISYTDKNGSDSIYSPYKFFVKLNGKWVFFPNPNVIFDK